MSSFDRNKVKEILRPIVKSAYEAQRDADRELHKNTIDVFSAVIESTIKGISMEEWMIQEKQRQIQKTLQNKIGELHQGVLGTIDGINNLKTGNIVDLNAEEKGFIAEVKNKHNTTKGNHKKSIYEDLKACLDKSSNEDLIGYYVEILPKNGKSYDEVFTPSDNVHKNRKQTNERIRRIDGKSFYEKATGNPRAILELYQLLPVLTSEILEEEYGEKRNPSSYINMEEFERVYGKLN